MSQKLDLKLKGLNINPNDMSEVPAGSLLVADNVVIDKESIIESRRGFKFYNDGTSNGQASKLFQYKNKLLMINTESDLYYDKNNLGTQWTKLGFSYPKLPDAVRQRSMEANRNFYFTSVDGVYKLDKLEDSSIPVLAGIPAGLDGQAIVNGTSGFLEPNRALAYRVVWGFKDANQNLILGAPSERILVANTSMTDSCDVQLTFTIPREITVNHFFQIYRSAQSANATTEANDEMQLVYEKNPTSAEITASEVTVVDQTPDDLKGANLYTNPTSGEGIARANYQPPVSHDIDVYQNCAFYANTIGRQRFNFTLISVGDTSFNYRVLGTVTSAGSNVLTGTFTGVRLGQVLIPTTGTYPQFADANASPAAPLTEVIEIISPTSIRVSRIISAGSYDITACDQIFINYVPYVGGPTEINGTKFAQFKVETSFTPAENIALTAKSFIKLFNKANYNNNIYAYYLSGYNDLPGKILLEASTELSGVFSSFPIQSTNANSFSPALDWFFGTPPEQYFSTSEVKQNRIYISKTSQPEAVPLLSYLDIGSADYPIKRILALRDALFVLKDDGIYRITGTDPSSFSSTLLDNTTTLRASETAVTFNNQIFCFSDQGVVSISDTGVQVISRAIENELLRISSDSFTNFESASFGISYESERKYILFTLTDKTDTVPTQAFVYNSFTNSWTRWTMSKTCGIVGRRDNKLYLGDGTQSIFGNTSTVYKERKDYTIYDYADESFDITIDAISSDKKTLTLSGTNLTYVEVGMTIKQDEKNVLIIALDGNQITVDRVLDFTVGAAEIFKPIINELRFIPVTCDNPGLNKQFRELSLIFRNATFYKLELGFSSNFISSKSYVTVQPFGQGSWGSFPWGQEPWGGVQGGQQAIRTFIPLEKQRALWLNLSLTNKQAFTSLSLGGLSFIFNPMSERFK